MASWWATQAPELRSRDGSQALIVATVSATSRHSADGNVQRIITDLGQGTSALAVAVGGPLGASHDIGAQVGADLLHAESLAVPITLILLAVAFASLMAASLPIAIGAVAIFGAFAELFLVSQVTDVSIYSINLATGLGLGLGIDYAFLIISRFREELEGQSSQDALRRTLATAGRTVIFSSLAVAAAFRRSWYFRCISFAPLPTRASAWS